MPPGVCDSSGVCSIDIDNQKPFCSGPSCSLASAVAVVAKTNTTASAATRTITIHGRCTGDPAIVRGLFNLVITGDPPSDTHFNGCSGDKGPPPGTLTSTVARKNPPFVIPTGSNGEVIKVVSSTKVTVKYLNIRDGRFVPSNVDDGIDYKTSTGGRVFCNCITNNEEGLDVDGGTCNQVEQNLVLENENGIRASAGAKWIDYRNNTSMNNDLPQTEPASDAAGRHNGLILSVSTTANNFVGNVAMNDRTGASDDGIKFFSSSGNCAADNVIVNFGGTPNTNPSSDDTGGCEIFNSSNNKVINTTFSGNLTLSHAPADCCKIISGTGNCVDHVCPGSVAASPCTVSSCPALFQSQSPSAPCVIQPIP